MRFEQAQYDYIVPSWYKINTYLYQAFLRYLEYRPEILIATFECMIDSFNGRSWYEHCRCCQAEFLTFAPDGQIGGCPFSEDDNIGNVDMSTDEILKSKERAELISKEQKLPDKCYKCKWLSCCKGDCFHMLWQDTVCPTPVSIYEYLAQHKIESVVNKCGPNI